MQIHFKLISLFYLIFLPILCLYFYNLLHDTQKQTKNLAIRMMLIGFAPLAYSPFDTRLIHFLDFMSLMLFIPIVLVLCIGSCMMRFSILIHTKYLYHLSFICGYCFVMLCIYLFFDNTPYQQELLGYLTTLL
ncbi:hypothetical protein BBW65_01070 [Helicobacter enhydrae]|uniref:Uncharacterized protein n=1 Tax=Helicobacter enhydrae TaxID=222136 RepID=A0A1B1U410_9HELI|nr:hypothetical protein [Helicobacter enhydrae]ANV97489.1 hypothetical protein BBW65_01070 [Helicobacter enhydrae]